ncbi:hypothetical protein JM80_1152 [Cellulophaga sp. RHA_52]|uniref:hypothetical protein n=1 Tax=Cellulophaga sp. RHA_52 TaxID=1250036 RepID=UPI001199C24C|nr:hypothetical protein [Cellulophaga sp. RHA_52]TVZ08653.1 hypothetical protein JM80_1152 [Cellulophaga sp. RHA_52]
MKKFKANKELASILFKQGFVDTTSQRDKIKGKQSFKMSVRARKSIYFDYDTIKIIKGYHITESTMSLTEEQLKIILLYFKLPTSDSNIFESTDGFKINYAIDKLKSLQKELLLLSDIESKSKKFKKKYRIADLYNSIVF